MRFSRFTPIFLTIAATLVLVLGFSRSPARADEPTSMPALVDVSDQTAVTAAMGKDVDVEGTIDSAEWSSSGTVLRVEFKNTDETKVMAVAFQKKKDALDKAFGGDVGKTLTGAHVRIHGELKDYKGKPEVVIDQPSQITIVEAAPTTNPS